MIKAVIDTNVFVSGFLGKGPPHQILAAWTALKFKLIVSSEILVEYEAVLNRLLDHSPFLVNRTIETIQLHAEFAQPVGSTKPICRDPNDEMFITAALAGGAKYIVSGDKDLLVLNPILNIEVLTPRAFNELLK